MDISVALLSMGGLNIRTPVWQQFVTIYDALTSPIIQPRLSHNRMISSLHTVRLVLSAEFTDGPLNILATWLGVEQKLGGTSKAGFFKKKFLGRSSKVIGSAGMTG